MENILDRRDFLKLAGLAGVMFVSGLDGCSDMPKRCEAEEFYWVQPSDSHRGFNGRKVKRGCGRHLEESGRRGQQPDFIVLDNVSGPTASMAGRSCRGSQRICTRFPFVIYSRRLCGGVMP